MPKLFSALRGLFPRSLAANWGLADLSSNSAKAVASMEAMEPRRMLSVSQSSDGWTTVIPAPDTHVIYVSSSAGSDSNNGTSPNAPVQSVVHAVGMLRDGSADWMLLKCGDTWNTGLGVWRKSGRSNEEPMVIGSYGTGARPLLMTGSQPGLWAASISNQEIDHLDILGVHFYADGRDPASPTFSGPADVIGIDILTQTDGITIENCQMEDYAVDINLQSYYGPITNASVRRNVIDDAYATTTHSQGLYAYGVNNLLVEGNTFDRNGYNNAVPGAGPTYYNHDCYLSSNNTNVVVRDNIFARAAGYGLQARSGGIIENNLFIDDPIGMSFGLVNGSHTTAGGVTGIVNGNVFVGGGNLNGSPYGQGIVLGNTRVGYPTVVSNNIFDESIAGALSAITLDYGLGQVDPRDSVGLNDLNIEHNIIYNWNRGVEVESGFQFGGSGLQALNDVKIRENDFQNVSGYLVHALGELDSSQLQWSANTYSLNPPTVEINNKVMAFDQWSKTYEASAGQSTVAYVDPTRTIESYDAAVGGLATADDFIMQARQQSQQNWQAQYTPASVIWYMRNGFDVAAHPHDWAPPTPPIVSSVSVPASVIAKESSLTFTVNYLSDQAINLASFSSGNLTVTARGFSAPAEFISSSGAGTQVSATYTVAAPRGMFRRGHPYKLSISVNAGQVTDNQGYATEAGVVDAFKLRVLPRPQPPRVRHISFDHAGGSVRVQFSTDVSASLNVADLLLQSDTGHTIVDPSAMTVSWDANRNTATWLFSGEPEASIPAGQWHLQIFGSMLVDQLKQPLSGNHGHDFIVPGFYVVK